MLFILVAEPLAVQIRTSKSIKGLKNGNKESKVSLYADDTTTFIHDDSSAVALFALLDRFSTLSELRINKSKTGLWLGFWKNRLGKDEPFGISWPKQYVSSLRVVFAYETHVGENINFDERLDKMKKVLNLWSGRRLSILGRIAIVKRLQLSKLVYNCSVLDTPTDFAKEVNKVFSPFIWNFKPDKIKRSTLTGPISKGVLNMVNFADVKKSLKATWVNRYWSSDGHHWCALLDSHLEKFGDSFLFQCNYDLKFLDLEGLPLFYRNILTVWQILHSKVPLTVNEIKEEILWNTALLRSAKDVFL